MNEYLYVSLLSNAIFYKSVSKKNNELLMFLFYIFLIIKIINLIISDVFQINADTLMVVNFIFSLLFVQALK